MTEEQTIEASDSRPGRHMSRERFIEEIGIVFDAFHLPRMAGRVLGALFLAPADGLSAGELADLLGASKGSISTMTQLLVHYRFVDRARRAGDRRDRFVIGRGSSARMLLWRMELLGRLEELASDGLALLDPDGNPEPLTEVRDMYGFLERELPALLRRWEQERRPSGGEARR